jgi:hypothetical protein
VWQLLVPVEKKLYTSETRLFWLELEAPFYDLRGLCGRFEGGGRSVAGGRFAVITDLGWYFVGGDS